MRKKRMKSVLFAGCAAIFLSTISTPALAAGKTSFSDVEPGSWCEDAIQYCNDKGIMTGSTSTRFDPSQATNRAMVVTVLHRVEGRPSSSSESTFKDVPKNSYYYDAVNWASENGIVNGYDKDRFGPADNITREQIATILKRYNDYKEKESDFNKSNDLSLFNDTNFISGYALEPLQWAVGNGLITGINSTTLAPQNQASRAQTATILYRYLDNHPAKVLEFVDLIKEASKNAAALDTDGGSIIGLRKDGTACALDYTVVLDEEGMGSARNPIKDWKDINDFIAVSDGGWHMVGLRKDGTVVAVINDKRLNAPDCGQCDVSNWKDIVAISAAPHYTVGLKKDGTVIATGNNEYGQCDVSNWTDIIAVSAGGDHTVGLKKDGSVVATGKNTAGECNVSDWKDIAAISAYSPYTVGLKKDGTAIMTGTSDDMKNPDVSDWKDIIAVSVNLLGVIGLTKDGTVVISRCNSPEIAHFHSGWKDIVAITTGYTNVAGLKRDGTVMVTGNSADVLSAIILAEKWTNIGVPDF